MRMRASTGDFNSRLFRFPGEMGGIISVDILVGLNLLFYRHFIEPNQYCKSHLGIHSWHMPARHHPST